MIKCECKYSEGGAGTECSMVIGGKALSQFEEAVTIVRRLYLHFNTKHYAGAGDAFLYMCRNAVTLDKELIAKGEMPFAPIENDGKAVNDEYVN